MYICVYVQYIIKKTQRRIMSRLLKANKKTLIIRFFSDSRSLYIILHFPSKQGSGGIKTRARL